MPDTPQDRKLVTALIIGSGFDALHDGGAGEFPETRFGMPSAPIRRIDLGGQQALALARHGDAHSIPPHAINYRANMLALRELGVTTVVALHTVGVLSGIRQPGELAVPIQLIDYTWGREHTIYDGSDGHVEHVEFTEPFSAALRHRLLGAATTAGVDCCDGGVYAATQGPRLETAAEIDRLARDGADFVGMTAMPEAAIACELGIEYASLSLVVNHAAGRSDTPIHEDVESSTLVARTAALKVLQEFLAEAAGSSS
jgi:purine nucleoside phosphorylase